MTGRQDDRQRTLDKYMIEDSMYYLFYGQAASPSLRYSRPQGKEKRRDIFIPYTHPPPPSPRLFISPPSAP